MKFVEVRFWNCRGDRGSDKKVLEGANIKEAIYLDFLKEVDEEEMKEEYMARNELEGWSDIYQGRFMEFCLKQICDGNKYVEGKIDSMDEFEYMVLEGEESVRVVARNNKALKAIIGQLVLDDVIHIY